jgi:hypothetical protein
MVATAKYWKEWFTRTIKRIFENKQYKNKKENNATNNFHFTEFGKVQQITINLKYKNSRSSSGFKWVRLSINLVSIFVFRNCCNYLKLEWYLLQFLLNSRKKLSQLICLKIFSVNKGEVSQWCGWMKAYPCI